MTTDGKGIDPADGGFCNSPAETEVPAIALVYDRLPRTSVPVPRAVPAGPQARQVHRRAHG